MSDRERSALGTDHNQCRADTANPASCREQSGDRGPAAPVATAPDENFEFDEQWYLARNPDVAAAVRSRGLPSGRYHYISSGRAENRLPAPPAPWREHNGTGFLAPRDLAVSPAPLTRIALIGSCMLESWGFSHKERLGCQVDQIIVNHVASLPELPPEVVRSYDFAVVQLPLGVFIPGHVMWPLPHGDEPAHEAAFARMCDFMECQLNTWMQWNRETGLLTFVANFMAPQQNAMGRLFPRFSFCNLEYMVTRLNEHLEAIVRRNKNAYILDIDRISASIGRRFIQDDSVVQSSHGAFISFNRPPPNRIEPVGPAVDYYDTSGLTLFPDLIWAELMAMYRTLRQIDAVKLVVVDLDDTLWNGVSGDIEDVNSTMLEGWPLGMAEALVHLKKRGILLGIASKNDEGRVRDIWPKLFGDWLSLDDFAAVRINWRPKAENMRDVLEGMNLLARNTVFVDDNPAERDAMRREFPDMRMLGGNPYFLKRVLLWSAETQVPVVTTESSRRTEMMRAQFVREDNRKVMSRGDFLADAAPVVTMLEIDGVGHARFSRVFELINKTNQFNTTGQRWKHEECEVFFVRGGKMWAFEVTDRFTSYGLVGVVIGGQGRIDQWVMSCRVLGYQIEEAVMAVIVRRLREMDCGLIVGRLIHTDVNFPCRDLFRKCGFDPIIEESGDWTLGVHRCLGVPDHVTVSGIESA